MGIYLKGGVETPTTVVETVLFEYVRMDDIYRGGGEGASCVFVARPCVGRRNAVLFFGVFFPRVGRGTKRFRFSTYACLRTWNRSFSFGGWAACGTSAYLRTYITHPESAHQVHTTEENTPSALSIRTCYVSGRGSKIQLLTIRFCFIIFFHYFFNHF